MTTVEHVTALERGQDSIMEVLEIHTKLLREMRNEMIQQFGYAEEDRKAIKADVAELKATASRIEQKINS